MVAGRSIQDEQQPTQARPLKPRAHYMGMHSDPRELRTNIVDAVSRHIRSRLESAASFSRLISAQRAVRL
eukprot:6657340-Prymnesium_polylepis.1